MASQPTYAERNAAGRALAKGPWGPALRGGKSRTDTTKLTMRIGRVELAGLLAIPSGSRMVVIFAHGIGSSRLSSRDQFVARSLNESGLATLLFDFLTPREEVIGLRLGGHRFNFDLPAERLAGVIDWVGSNDATREFRIGLFGSSTGAAVALMAAARRPSAVGAVVAAGGRPDLAGAVLGEVRAPTLLLAGGGDQRTIVLNEAARQRIGVGSRLEIIPGTGPLAEDLAMLEEVSRLACRWFRFNLGAWDALSE